MQGSELFEEELAEFWEFNRLKGLLFRRVLLFNEFGKLGVEVEFESVRLLLLLLPLLKRLPKESTEEKELSSKF